MTSDLDDLMDLDPCNLTKQDIDTIIIRMRHLLSQYDAGAKPIKTKPVVDTSSIVAALVPPAPTQKLRRI
jgi:hypothetical protein